MDNEDLKNWREQQGFTQQQVAESLDIALNTYQNYERGYRYMGTNETRVVKVPKSVALACAAITIGITHYVGEELEFD